MANPPSPEKTLLRVRGYIDALNLYHRIAEPNQFKWIDIKSLIRALIQLKLDENNEGEFQVEIEGIYLFTSEVIGDAARSRQNAYLGALEEKYGDILEIVRGDMAEVEKPGKPIDDEIKKVVKNKKGLIYINTYEEKQTDVNIGCQMVYDACIAMNQDDADKKFDVACLVSSDSDLIAPLKINNRLGQRTLWICSRTKDKKLPEIFENVVSVKDRIPYIPRAVLLNHRLPLQVGRWSCPERWKEQDEKQRKRNNEPLLE